MYHRGMNRALVACALLVGVAQTGCDRWGSLRGAVPLGNLRQSSCGRGKVAEPTVEAKATSGHISAIAREVTFRCNQPAHALIRRGSKELELLVEPLDMDPTNIPKCICNYDLEFEIDGLSRGTYTLTVFHRGDHQWDTQDAVRVGSASVAVP
jgi:hypothetical protein